MKTFSEWYTETYPYANSPTQSKMLYEVWAYQQDIIDKMAEVVRMLDYVHNGHPPKALSVREFDLICIEDKYKMPASWSVSAIKAKLILDKLERGRL